jgi:hypothetical protein
MDAAVRRRGSVSGMIAEDASRDAERRTNVNFPAKATIAFVHWSWVIL